VLLSLVQPLQGRHTGAVNFINIPLPPSIHRPLHSKRASPFVSPSAAARWGFGLQAAQLWELVRDVGLISRHTPLSAVDDAVALSRQPPPPVAARRQRVLAAGGAAAAAVLCDAVGTWPAYHLGETARTGSCPPASATAPHDPLTELSFREFCESLVRVAARRYPQVAGLARRVQTVLQHHVAPLLSASAGAGAGARRQPVAPTPSSTFTGQRTIAGGGAAAALSIMEQDLVSEEVVAYLRSVAEPLQRAFAAVALANTGFVAPATNTTAPAKWGVTCTRAVLRALKLSGVMEAQRLKAAEVAAALLDGQLGAKDVEAPR